MKYTNSSLHQASIPGWQILGELELTARMYTDHTLNEWLGAVLSPLELNADFLDRILTSVKEVMARVEKATFDRFEHIHLLVFIPRNLVFKGGSAWGFFHVNRANHATGSGMLLDHTINFYLYREGE